MFLVSGTLALAGVGLVFLRRSIRKARTAQASAEPSREREELPDGEPSAPAGILPGEPAPTSAGQQREEAAPGDAPPLEGSSDTGRQLESLLDAGMEAIEAGNIVAGGIVVAGGLGVLVEDLFNEGDAAGDVARVGGIALAPGFIAAEAVEQGLGLIGITDPNVVETAEELAFIAGVAPPLLPLTITVQVLSGLLNWVGGPLDAIVDKLAGELDPFNPDGFVGGIVANIGGAIDSLFGGSADDGPEYGKDGIPPLAALITPEEASGDPMYIPSMARSRLHSLQTGATRIALVLSAQHYGDEAPIFRVLVNGQYHHGGLAVTANVNAGEWQLFYLFPTAKWETLTIAWDNDAYGGAANKDRNLIVGRVIDGGTVLDFADAVYRVADGRQLPGTQALLSAGSLTFTSAYGRRMTEIRILQAQRLAELEVRRAAEQEEAERVRREAQQQQAPTTGRGSGRRPMEEP